jgi:hypothetical protein
MCRGVYPQQKIEKTSIGGRKTGGKKRYDKESRERKFLPQWTKDRSWLAYEEYKQLMFCNWCRNHEVDRVFVKETNTFVSSNLMLSNSTKVVSHTSIINLGTTVHLKPN